MNASRISSAGSYTSPKPHRQALLSHLHLFVHHLIEAAFQRPSSSRRLTNCLCSCLCARSTFSGRSLSRSSPATRPCTSRRFQVRPDWKKAVPQADWVSCLSKLGCPIVIYPAGVCKGSRQEACSAANADERRAASGQCLPLKADDLMTDSEACECHALPGASTVCARSTATPDLQ